MELREWALRILSGADLEDKLFDPLHVTDDSPGPVYFFDEPARASYLRLQRREKSGRLPAFQDHASEQARISCLHRFCGHELLAVELLAFAVLAYPQAPRGYRKSLVHHLREEQSHVKLYRKRLQEMGSDLGNEPLYRHFWSVSGYLHSLDHFLSFMNLTIEQANLDFSPMYLSSFLRHGDIESARVMRTILEEEIGHVRLGMHWLKRLNPRCDDELLYQHWHKHLPTPFTAQRAMGFVCHVAPRRAAGIGDYWIDQICPSRSKQVTTPLSRWQTII